MRRQIPTLSYVLGMHLLRISEVVTRNQVEFIDIAREVRFFCSIGYKRYLSKSKSFAAKWEGWTNQRTMALRGLVECEASGRSFQEWKFDEDMKVLEAATAIYAHLGLLVIKETPHDGPELESDLGLGDDWQPAEMEEFVLA